MFHSVLIPPSSPAVTAYGQMSTDLDIHGFRCEKNKTLDLREDESFPMKQSMQPRMHVRTDEINTVVIVHLHIYNQKQQGTKRHREQILSKYSGLLKFVSARGKLQNLPLEARLKCSDVRTKTLTYILRIQLTNVTWLTLFFFVQRENI